MADNTTDLLRYTVVSDRDSFVDNARGTVDEMVERGWSVKEAESSFLPDNRYKGLHVLMDKEGDTIEMQFHTEQSVELKGRTHDDYEIARDLDQDYEDRVAAEQRMVDASRSVEDPPGLDRLKELGGVPVLEKRYERLL